MSDDPTGPPETGNADGSLADPVNLEPAPLAHDGWLEFNRIKRGVEPLRFHHEDGKIGSIDAVFYLNRAGRIWLPPLNPFAPLSWSSRGGDTNYRRVREWLSLAQPVADEMRVRGLVNRIAFPVGIDDMRPWQWAGFRITVSYTFFASLPVDPAETDPAVRRKVRQALERGYTADRVFQPAHAVMCLLETERRQGFSYNLTVTDFERLRDLLGMDRLRMYICYAPNGEPASVRVVLHARGHPAIDWVSGTRFDHLQSGATQLLIRTALDDAAAGGASAFDFEGASIPGVAAAKMTWGAQLMPWYQVESYGARSAARWAREWLRFARAPRR